MNTKYLEIDSDIGPIQLKIDYDIEWGEPGDYYQPRVYPNVNIFKVELDGPLKISKDIKDEMENEILDDERSYDSED
jgi:hypothetical protein